MSVWRTPTKCHCYPHDELVEHDQDFQISFLLFTMFSVFCVGGVVGNSIVLLTSIPSFSQDFEFLLGSANVIVFLAMSGGFVPWIMDSVASITVLFERHIHSDTLYIIRVLPPFPRQYHHHLHPKGTEQHFLSGVVVLALKTLH